MPASSMEKLQLISLVALVVLLYFADSQAKAIVDVNVGEFNNDYRGYMRYTASTKTTMTLNFIQANKNIGIHVNPRYKDDDDCHGYSALVLNNKVSGNWQKEIRPSGFNFLTDTVTSMVITPQTDKYRILFDFGNKRQSFTFPYRNSHKPSLVTLVRGFGHSRCSKNIPTLHEVAVGHIIRDLQIGSVIQVFGTAPINGIVKIDLTQGLAETRDDNLVFMRMIVTFGQSENTISFQTVTSGGEENTVQTVDNTIEPGSKFSMSIVAQRNQLRVAANCRFVSAVPIENALSGDATLWVSGLSDLEKIAVY